MPTSKKPDNNEAAKEPLATKKKCCRKSACKPVEVAQEAPAARKCCKKKTESAEKTPMPVVEPVIKAPVKKAVKKAPAKKVATPAPAPAASNNDFTDEQTDAIAAAKAQLDADPEWAPFVQSQRQHLLDLRDRALDNMTGVARDTLRNHPEGSEASGSGEHQADAGSDAYDRDFALSLLSKEQDGLYEIEQALARIDNGTYGICEMSYKIIPVLRLEAIPFARLTVECQAQWEKEKGQNARFRPRVALGFAGGQNDVDLSVSLDDDEE